MAKQDDLLAASLAGTATRLAANHQGDSIADCAAELARLAGGRYDLLIREAGILGGAWSVQPVTRWWSPLAVGLLLVAADGHVEGLERWVEQGRRNALAVSQGVYGRGGPPGSS